MTSKAFEQVCTLATLQTACSWIFKAVFCFRKANDKDGEILASAYLAELKGKEYRARGLRERSNLAFEDACGSFLKVGRIAKAAECQEAVENFTAAAGNASIKLANY